MQILTGHLDDIHYHEKGFTLLEILTVLAILALLASVVLPNLAAFLSSAQVAAANTEVANVETAVISYYGSYGYWPSDTNTDLVSNGYLSTDSVYNYTFDEFGRVNVEDETTWPNDANVTWSVAYHTWRK